MFPEWNRTEQASTDAVPRCPRFRLQPWPLLGRPDEKRSSSARCEQLLAPAETAASCAALPAARDSEREVGGALVGPWWGPMGARTETETWTESE